MHTDLELKLPSGFKSYVDKEEVYDYPNTNKCSKSMVCITVILLLLYVIKLIRI